MQESSVSPTAIQYGGGPGRGIAQWSVGGRWNSSHDDNVAWYANAHGMSRWALTAQLDFIWFELTHDGYGYHTLKDSTTVAGATDAFMRYYEICGACDETNRIHYADQVLSEYGGTSAHVATGDSAPTCYSDTVGGDIADGACVQSKYDGLWYQCDGGEFVDRDSSPNPCTAEYPL
jgi:hypothetical protein